MTFHKSAVKHNIVQMNTLFITCEYLVFSLYFIHFTNYSFVLFFALPFVAVISFFYFFNFINMGFIKGFYSGLVKTNLCRNSLNNDTKIKCIIILIISRNIIIIMPILLRL